jgi:hypothetical protein
MSMPGFPDPATRRRLVTIIGAALMASCVFYWITAEVFVRTANGGRPRGVFPGDARVAHAALIVGVAAVLLAGLARRSLLASGPADPGARIQRAIVLSLVIAEIPAALGIFAVVLTGTTEAGYPLFVLGLAALAFYFPRAAQWEDWTRQVEMDASRHPTP